MPKILENENKALKKIKSFCGAESPRNKACNQYRY